MTNIEPERDEILKSQQNLLDKILHSNRLYRNHLYLLVFFLISSVLATILLIFSLSKSLPTEPLSPFSLLQLILLITMLVILGLQIRFHGSFLTKTNRSFSNIERNPSSLYYGLTSYVNTLSLLFNPSESKKPLSQIMTYYLFLHFYLGFAIFFLFSNVADLANTNFLLEPVLAILLLLMLSIWIFIFISSIKINKNVQEWEDKFTKLEVWAQNIEEDTSEIVIFQANDDKESK